MITDLWRLVEEEKIERIACAHNEHRRPKRNLTFFEDRDLVMKRVDIESVKMIVGHDSVVSLGHEMTYSKTFNNSELIAVAENTSDVVTYYKPHIHTLYKAKVVRVIKGSAPQFVYITQGAGYFPEFDAFVHLKHQVVLKPKERWLFFGSKRDMKGAPHGETFHTDYMCLKLEDDGKLYSIDNYNETWRRLFQSDGKLSEDQRIERGIQDLPSMYDMLHVEGLTVEEFIKKYQKS